MPEPKKIILAEDDEFLSSLLKNRLQREGFDIKLAKSGDEALAALRKSKPDLLLLDIILPNKIGFDIIEELRDDKSYGPLPPFIVISNLGQEEDIRRAKDLGALEYFIKARIIIDDLIKRVTLILSPDQPASSKK